MLETECAFGKAYRNVYDAKILVDLRFFPSSIYPYLVF